MSTLSEKQPTFRVLAVFFASLMEVDAMSCLCISVAVEIGVLVSSNPYCCLGKNKPIVIRTDVHNEFIQHSRILSFGC